MAVSVAIDRHHGVSNNVRTPDNRGRDDRSRRKTRSAPETTAAGADTHSVGPRPRDFFSWWAWGVAQCSNLAATPPLAIHSESGDRDDWGLSDPEVKKRLRNASLGLPFTRAFESYIERHRPFVSGAFTRGASHMYSSPQSEEFKLVFALMCGHTDPEIVRIVLLGSPHRAAFDALAVRALSFVYDKIEAELAKVKDPN